MEVYIEYVIIDNLIINTLIMLAAVKTMHLRKCRWRIALSACFGTLAAIIYPWVPLRGVLLWLYKAAIALIMVAIVMRPLPLRRYFATVGIMVMYTFGAGGAALGIILLSGGNIVDSINLSYVSQVPVGVIMAALAGGIVYTYRAAALYTARKNIAPHLRRVELMMGGKVWELQGYVDSGNMMFEPVSGLPVVVVDSGRLKHKPNKDIAKGSGVDSSGEDAPLPDINDMLMTLDADYLAGLDKSVLDTFKALGGVKSTKAAAENTGQCGAEPCATMEYMTAGGRTVMKLFRPDKIKIYSGDKANIIYDVLVGFCEYKLGGGAFDMLIHPALVQNT